MNTYTDVEREKDFNYFVNNYNYFYEKYGHKFLAIKNEEVIGVYNSVDEAIENLSGKYELSSYIIQECTGEESAYTITIMRLLIKGLEE